MTDMNYGILASGSSLLTDIADKLHENTKKLSTGAQFSKNLQPGIPQIATKNYLLYVKTLCP